MENSSISVRGPRCDGDELVSFASLQVLLTWRLFTTLGSGLRVLSDKAHSVEPLGSSSLISEAEEKAWKNDLFSAWATVGTPANIK